MYRPPKYQALLLMALCFLAACQAPAPPKMPQPQKSPEEAQAELDLKFAKTDIQITLDEFNQIRPGMTLDQVVEIIGAEETSTNTRYNPGSADTFSHPSMTLVYRWENPDGSWCELEFIDKKLETKRHQDLKPASAYAGSNFTLPETRHALKAISHQP